MANGMSGAKTHPPALAVIGALAFIAVMAALVVPQSLERILWPAGGNAQGPPTLAIADVRVADVTENSAAVTWRTSEPADSQVIWGSETERNRATRRQPALVVEHKVKIEGMDSGSDYGITAVSANQAGLIVSAAGPAFRTLGFSRLADLCATPVGKVFAQLPPMGTGAAWADFNNDGRLDVFVASEGLSGSRLMKNTPDGYADATALSSTAFGGRGRQPAWADFNADGYPDLFLTSGRGAALFVNEGPPNFTFRESNELLPPAKSYDTEGAGWLDYNNDGKPDILLTNGRYGILVYENISVPGKPGFRDVSGQVGLGPEGFGAGFGDYVSIGDYDGDGRTDFLYSLYTGILGRNVGGRFEKMDGAGINYLCTSTRKLGTAFGDYDNDGHTDIFVPQRGTSRLYRNKGNGTFEDVAKKAGLLENDMDGVSAAWGDINNDGHLDLFVGCEGSGNRLFLNSGNGTFRDATAKFGVAGEGNRARGVTFVDHDDDGDLDLYVHNYQAPDYFYENNLITPDNHNFVKVKFAAKKRCPIGAVVRLIGADGKLRGLREISGGQGFGSQEPSEAHFGAPPGRYKVQVRYSSGAAAEQEIAVDPRGANRATFE